MAKRLSCGAALGWRQKNIARKHKDKTEDIDEMGCHGPNIPDLKHCPFTKGCILGDLKLILEPHVFNSMFDNDHSIRAYKWRAMSSMPYNENGWIVS